MLDHLRGDRVGAGLAAGAAREVDGEHVVGSIPRRRERLERGLDPLRRRLLEIEVAIDARGHALAAERRQALVERPPGRAEVRIGRIAERQHGILDALERHLRPADQLLVGAGRPCGRLALAPGGGDHEEALGLRQRRDLEVGHVDDLRLEPELAGELGGVPGEALRVAQFAGVHDRERLGRPRDRRGGRLRRPAGLQAGQEARQPRALDRRRRAEDAVEAREIVLSEGSRGREESGPCHGPECRQRRARSQ